MGFFFFLLSYKCRFVKMCMYGNRILEQEGKRINMMMKAHKEYMNDENEYTHISITNQSSVFFISTRMCLHVRHNVLFCTYIFAMLYGEEDMSYYPCTSIPLWYHYNVYFSVFINQIKNNLSNII